MTSLHCTTDADHVPPAGPECRHKVKFDGWRVQVWKRGKNEELLSRRGHDIGQCAPAIVRALAALDTDDCILDAELVALDETATRLLSHRHDAQPALSDVASTSSGATAMTYAPS